MRLTKGVALFAVMTICTAQAVAQKQRVPSANEFDRAKAIFAKILRNDDAAQRHLLYLSAYLDRSPWQFRTLVSVTQRLAVSGVSIQEIDDALIPCGDVAIAASVEDDDDVFAQIVLLTLSLKTEEHTATALRAFEDTGVPVFNLLGEALGYAPEKVRNLAESGRLKGEGTKKILLEAFTRHYDGLAKQRAEKLKERN